MKKINKIVVFYDDGTFEELGTQVNLQAAPNVKWPFTDASPCIVPKQFDPLNPYFTVTTTC